MLAGTGRPLDCRSMGDAGAPTMNVCAAGCALSAALQSFFWLGVYLWTIFGLRPLVLGPGEPGAGPPVSAELQLTHHILSIGVIAGAILTGVAAGSALATPPLSFGLGALVMVGLCNGANGLFELLSGVCPIYGVIHKRHSRQRFLRHPRVRLLGLVRLLVSAALVGVGALLLAAS
jgi:hypothetical protein